MRDDLRLRLTLFDPVSKQEMLHEVFISRDQFGETEKTRMEALQKTSQATAQLLDSFENLRLQLSQRGVYL